MSTHTAQQSLTRARKGVGVAGSGTPAGHRKPKRRGASPLTLLVFALPRRTGGHGGPPARPATTPAAEDAALPTA